MQNWTKYLQSIFRLIVVIGTLCLVSCNSDLKNKVELQNNRILELDEENNQLQSNVYLLKDENKSLKEDLEAEKELSRLWEERCELFVNEIEFGTVYNGSEEIKLKGGLNGAMKETFRLREGMCFECKKSLIFNYDNNSAY